MRTQKPGAQIMCAVRSSAIVLPEVPRGACTFSIDGVPLTFRKSQ